MRNFQDIVHQHSCNQLYQLFVVCVGERERGRERERKGGERKPTSEANGRIWRTLVMSSWRPVSSTPGFPNLQWVCARRNMHHVSEHELQQLFKGQLVGYTVLQSQPLGDNQGPLQHRNKPTKQREIHNIAQQPATTERQGFHIFYSHLLNLLRLLTTLLGFLDCFNCVSF